MVTPRSTSTWPSSGGSWPVIMRNSVVLPAPLGPTRPIFSPFWSAAEASMKRICWPFCLLMLSRRIMGRAYGTPRPAVEGYFACSSAATNISSSVSLKASMLP